MTPRTPSGFSALLISVGPFFLTQSTACAFRNTLLPIEDLGIACDNLQPKQYKKVDDAEMAFATTSQKR